MKLSTVVLVACVSARACGLEGSGDSGDAAKPAQVAQASGDAAAAEPPGPEAAPTAEPAAKPEPTPTDADVEAPPTDPVAPAEAEVADLRALPKIDELEVELHTNPEESALYLDVALSNLTGTTAETLPVVVAVCREADQEYVAFARALAKPSKGTTGSIGESLSLRAEPQACSIRVVLPPLSVGGAAKIVDERCFADSKLTPGPCAQPFEQVEAPQPVTAATFVVTGAPKWVPYTGARPHGADVLVDIDLGLTHAVSGIGKLRAFVQCDDADEEELTDSDAEITMVDDLSWVAPSQHVRIRGASIAMLSTKAKACAVRVTAQPIEPNAEPITVVEWCLGADEAKLGACSA